MRGRRDSSGRVRGRGGGALSSLRLRRHLRQLRTFGRRRGRRNRNGSSSRCDRGEGQIEHEAQGRGATDAARHRVLLLDFFEVFLLSEVSRRKKQSLSSNLSFISLQKRLSLSQKARLVFFSPPSFSSPALFTFKVIEASLFLLQISRRENNNSSQRRKVKGSEEETKKGASSSSFSFFLLRPGFLLLPVSALFLPFTLAFLTRIPFPVPSSTSPFDRNDRKRERQKRSLTLRKKGEMSVNASPLRRPFLSFLLLVLVLSVPFAALAEDAASSVRASAPAPSSVALPSAPIPLPQAALVGLSDADASLSSSAAAAAVLSAGPPPFPKDPAELAALIGAAAREATAEGSRNALGAISGGGVPKMAAAAAAAAAAALQRASEKAAAAKEAAASAESAAGDSTNALLFSSEAISAFSFPGLSDSAPGVFAVNAALSSALSDASRRAKEGREGALRFAAGFKNEGGTGSGAGGGKAAGAESIVEGKAPSPAAAKAAAAVKAVAAAPAPAPKKKAAAAAPGVAE